MCTCAVCGGEEEFETQIRKPAGEGGSAKTHKRAHRAREYSTMTGLVALSGGRRAQGKEECALSDLKMPLENGRDQEL
jgi:hypothetical protein